MDKKTKVGLSIVFVVFCCLLLPNFPGTAQEGVRHPEASGDVKHDVSPPLRDIVPSPRPVGTHVIPLRLPHPPQVLLARPDPVLQTSAGPLVGTTAGLSFAGVGDGDYGFVPDSAPPDTNGAVGETQFVQWVNESFAVFDKTTGGLVYGPVAGNTLWSGFGGQCEAHNDGDIIAQYDKIAGRWVMAQPVFESPYAYCIAVSTTSDATGTYNRYAFSMPSLPDYPKLGVWPDAYYASVNMYTTHIIGARACALDRSAMLAGSAATQVCFQLDRKFASLLPSDLDGPASPPPKGEPDFFLNQDTDSLNLWKFHVDFATPANSTFTGPTNIPVAAFSEACNGRSCIPQPGTVEKLDSLGDRLMYRLAYRNFGDHEALVASHSVAVGNGKSGTGVRWYELRDPDGTPTVFQQGTFAPDANFRWMGSIAMDKVGDIALGYSVSSSTLFPSVRYTGRVPGDTLGTMEAENSIKAGTGSQLRKLNRWGDYSSMSVDPVDDCTFWYTTNT